MSFDDQSQGYLENGYALGRGYVSSLRLNQQNRLLRDLVGYSIHPEILLKGRLPSNPRVADVGTGTGQWLIDTTDQIRSSQLDGFDISTDQFPNKAWLPANVSLHQLDITKPIPASLEGLYDLVHVQFFLCVVQRDGPAAILKELYKMLSTSSRKYRFSRKIHHFYDFSRSLEKLVQ
ncbi:hypothetical protein MMC31_005360 [Peltigera leucophlebia]|nr:hypothetical protein [Peltigera leucophlebia]